MEHNSSAIVYIFFKFLHNLNIVRIKMKVLVRNPQQFENPSAKACYQAVRFGLRQLQLSLFPHCFAKAHSGTEFYECSQRQHNRINNRIHAHSAYKLLWHYEAAPLQDMV
ncbi:hypothetical protein J6590_072863 [Homalodisca vitripennis]|nr:hypothetical protein J6590_072863 [Homalodisca vitripennis]